MCQNNALLEIRCCGSNHYIHQSIVLELLFFRICPLFPALKSKLESPAQLENRIKPQVYIRRVNHSTIYKKTSLLLAGTGVRRNRTVASGFSRIKIH